MSIIHIDQIKCIDRQKHKYAVNLAELTDKASFIDGAKVKTKEKSLEEQIYEKQGNEALEKLGASQPEEDK